MEENISAAPDEAAPTTAKRRFATIAVWVSLFGSVLGTLSAFGNLIPTLTRLSFITKLVFALYHITRDQVWTYLRGSLTWVHIFVPDILPIWKDGIVVGLLVFAALNFESIRQDKTLFVVSLLEEIARWFRRFVFNKEQKCEKNLFGWKLPGARAIDFLGYFCSVFVYCWILSGILRRYCYTCFVPSSFLQHDVLSSHIFDFLLLYIAKENIGRIFDYIEAMFVYIWMVSLFRAGYNDLKPPFRNISGLFYIVMLCPTWVCGTLFVSMRNGWRAVLLALSMMAAIFGLNAAFLRWIDPMLVHPPILLKQIIEADPHSLQHFQDNRQK